MPFERAIEELELIVKRLEEGKVPLEELVAIYERGEALKRRCEDLLRQAEARVRKDHARCRRQADRHRAARRRVISGQIVGVIARVVFSAAAAPRRQQA